MRAHLDRLLELARKATPGPWRFVEGVFNGEGEEDQLGSIVNRDDWYIAAIESHTEDALGQNNDGANAAYIAALSPELVAALVKVAIEASEVYFGMNVSDAINREYEAVLELRDALDELRRAVGGET